jgi:sugar O-acyltransferase (sialic acid O-acetyltransferase NeuD family)
VVDTLPRSSIASNTQLAATIAKNGPLSYSLRKRLPYRYSPLKLAASVGKLSARRQHGSAVLIAGVTDTAKLHPALNESPATTDIGSAEVCIIGAGGHAKVVIATLVAARYEPMAIFDDDERKWGGKVLGVKVVGGTHLLESGERRLAVMGIGDNRARRALVARLPQLSWCTVVHPFACVHPGVALGPGSVVFAGAVVQPDVRIGAHCVINTGASVDHDCRLDDFVHIAPGAALAGTVTAGEGVLVGIGASIVPGRTIGAWATVGAGATVVNDIAAGCTAVGTPARCSRPRGQLA